MAYPYLSDLVATLTGVRLPLPIPMFGLFVATALLTASHWLTREVARRHAAGQIGPMQLRAKDGTVRAVPPQEGIHDLTMVAALCGIVGARVFHILENLDEFAIAPLSMIFSTAGLSIYGGLVAGTVAGIVWARKRRLALAPLLDAAAPALMLGYAIGRVGCQVSGDGDWGVAANLAAKPDWLPLWAWAQTYENNVVGAVIAAPGVYPTPLYEALMAGAAFLLLRALRGHRQQAGWLFALYLLLAGVERMLIEQIRINPVLDFVVVRATQAEFISGLLIAAGLAGLLLRRRAQKPIDKPASSERP